MLKIGLTGGIGSGKSTVANMFAQLDVPIIDTDQIARDVVAPHTVGWQSIKQHFGEAIIDAQTQTLNRKQLRQLIFANPEEKKWLENLLHPLIRNEVNLRLSKLISDYCILVIPLLFETTYSYNLDRILVVDSLPEQQISRVTSRDQISTELATEIMAQQINRKQRLQQADDIIDNTHENIKDLHSQVLALHQRYLQLAREQI
ncbi:MAG: dephospho-CoA kinase [Gammaproteobacteria bacterium]